MKFTAIRMGLLSSVAWVFASASLSAAPLVTNGGFETGDLTGWVNGGSVGATSSFASEGTYSAGS